MMMLLKLAWRSMMRSKRRTFISVSAIGFALALAVFFIAFAEGVYTQMIDEAVRMQAGHITLEHPRYRDAPAVDLTVASARDLRRRLAELEGVLRAKLLIHGQGVARSGHGTTGVGIMGVEPEVERRTSPIAGKIIRGSYLEGGGGRQVVVGRTLADRLDLELGSKLVITSNNKEGDLVEQLVRVRGIFATGSEEIDGHLVQMPLGFAQKLFELDDGEVTQIGLVLDDGDTRAHVMARVRAMVGDSEVAVLPWQEVMPELAAYIKLDGGSNLVMQGVLIFVSLFTIFNTILMSVLERTREFGVLLALGTEPWRLRAQVLLESALLGLLGCAVGLTAGGLLGYALEVRGLDLSRFYDEGITISGMVLSSRIYADVTAGILVGLGLVVFGATVLTGGFAVRHISRIDLAGVLRQGAA